MVSLKPPFVDTQGIINIGSNIFDVTVGLPFPWILKSWILGGEAIKVESTGMFCSIALV